MDSNPAIFEKTITTFERTQGFSANHTSQNFQILGMELLRFAIKQERQYRLLLQGELSWVDIFAEFNDIVAVTSSTRSIPLDHPQISGLTMSMALRHWSEQGMRPPKTLAQAQTSIGRFVDFLGDLPLADISTEETRSFLAALKKIPARLKINERKTPLKLLIERPINTNIQVISMRTVQRDWGILRAIAQCAVDAGEISRNPFSAIRPLVTGAQRQKRLPYGTEDLHRIFSSPLYLGCLSPRKRAKPGTLCLRDECWWLPLLAMFSGCRLEELGQLRTSDIRLESGIHILDINTLQPGKSIKNANSRRLVPIHPIAVSLGFLSYAANLPKTKEGFLFPNLKTNKFGARTAAWSKWWGRYAREIGITDPRKVFHSFRHTFKDACRNAGISEEMHDSLTGHASVSVGRSYGQGTSLEVRAQAMATIHYDNLNLEALLP